MLPSADESAIFDSLVDEGVDALQITACDVESGVFRGPFRRTPIQEGEERVLHRSNNWRILAWKFQFAWKRSAVCAEANALDRLRGRTFTLTNDHVKKTNDIISSEGSLYVLQEGVLTEGFEPIHPELLVVLSHGCSSEEGQLLDGLLRRITILNCGYEHLVDRCLSIVFSRIVIFRVAEFEI